MKSIIFLVLLIILQTHTKPIENVFEKLFEPLHSLHNSAQRNVFDPLKNTARSLTNTARDVLDPFNIFSEPRVDANANANATTDSIKNDLKLGAAAPANVQVITPEADADQSTDAGARATDVSQRELELDLKLNYLPPVPVPDNNPEVPPKTTDNLCTNQPPIATTVVGNNGGSNGHKYLTGGIQIGASYEHAKGDFNKALGALLSKSFHLGYITDKKKDFNIDFGSKWNAKLWGK